MDIETLPPPRRATALLRQLQLTMMMNRKRTSFEM